MLCRILPSACKIKSLVVRPNVPSRSSHRNFFLPFYNTMAVPLQANCLVDAGLEAQILLPNDARYAACTESYFDNAAKFQPVCYIQPRTSLDAAIAVKSLADARQPFAVRSGGCTVRPGSNNIDAGITVDLSLLKSIEYVADGTAHIGPGATWYVGFRVHHTEYIWIIWVDVYT